MKKILYLFLTVSLIFSSCKKDGDDNTPTGVQGCTDSDATNYNASATNDDASCMYDISGVWETTSAILNGVEQLGQLVDVDLTYIFADGQIGGEGYKAGDRTGYSIGVSSSLGPNSFLWEGSYYPEGGIATAGLVLNWNVDFMTNANNMTWRYVDYPNPGDTYVKTLVRSTTHLLSEWK